MFQERSKINSVKFCWEITMRSILATRKLLVTLKIPVACGSSIQIRMTWPENMCKAKQLRLTHQHKHQLNCTGVRERLLCLVLLKLGDVGACFHDVNDLVEWERLMMQRRNDASKEISLRIKRDRTKVSKTWPYIGKWSFLHCTRQKTMPMPVGLYAREGVHTQKRNFNWK